MKCQLLLVICLLVAGSVSAQIPLSGLEAYYPFDGNANDASGKNRNGAVTGATLTTDRFNQPNKAYSFNGTTDYIRVSSWQILTANATRSMSIWFKMPSPNNVNRSMVSWGNNAANNQLSWVSYYKNQNNNFGFFGWSNDYYLLNNFTYFDDRWHNIIITYSGNATMALWLDGVKIPSGNVTGNPSNLNTASTELLIGSSYVSNSFFQGQLDDIRIYNRGLTDTEILQLYQAEAPPTSTEYAKIGVNRFIHTVGLFNTSIGNMAGNALTSSSGTNNMFVGYQTGKDNSTGSFNAFIGYRAGYANTTGNQNTLVGAETGYALSGSGNTMVGYQAGKATSTGANNTFIGPKAGINTTTGSNNIIIGPSSGTNVTTGDDNVLMGYHSKAGDGRGRHNLIIGSEAGDGEWSGQGNTLIGYRASADSRNLQNATAIGANAHVAVSNAVALGNHANVGIGTSSPLARLHVVSDEDNTSGVRFGKLTANSPAVVNTSTFLTLNELGDVVLGRQSAGTLRLQTASVNHWPDFVFGENYPLMPLEKLGLYIRKNRHLPNLPSAQQMTQQGESVEELIKKLVKTQEEQARYLIELQQENQRLKSLLEKALQKRP